MNFKTYLRLLILLHSDFPGDIILTNLCLQKVGIVRKIVYKELQKYHFKCDTAKLENILSIANCVEDTIQRRHFRR
jgi:hypothetical protein